MRIKFIVQKKVLALVLAVSLSLAWMGPIAFASDSGVANGTSGSGESSDMWDSYLPSAGESGGSESVTITADAVVVRLGISGFDLLDGVTAEDENDDLVPVSVQDDGGFDIDAQDTYTVVYVSDHPGTGEIFTADRAVTVFPFDPQPTTLAEIQAAVDAYETAYQAALSSGGFFAALEVQKPRWQYEADTSLMPNGWRCDYLVDETYNVTYWSFFPSPMAMDATAQVSDETSLRNAIANPNCDTIEFAVSEITITATTLAIDRSLTFTSGTGSTVALKVGGSFRHMTINGNNITLKFTGVELVGRKADPNDTANPGGGIYVQSSNNAIISGVIVRDCYNNFYSPNLGGGIGVNGEVTIAGSTVIGNTAKSQGGGIYANGNITIDDCTVSENTVPGSVGGGIYATGEINIINSTVSDNTARYQGGGIYVYADSTANIENSIIRGNTGTEGGGLYSGNNATVNIKAGTAFKNNKAYADDNWAHTGGGMYISNGGIVNVTKAFFTENMAVSDGGGIYLNNGANGTTIITEGFFTGNTANDGGGMYLTNNSTATITKSSFTGNTANGKEMGIYWGHGGGIYHANSNYTGLKTDDHTIFSGNYATGRAYDYGENTPGYPNIEWKTVSIKETHALNNYDINYKIGTPVSTCTVTYNANGGAGDDKVLTIVSGASHKALALADTGISRDGYNFTGWNTANDGSGTVYYPGNNPDDIIDNVTANVTLYAQWTSKTYTVTVQTDGNGTASADNYTPSSGDTITLIATPNTGYEFQKWEVLAGVVTISSDNKFSMPAEDVTVKAIFKAKRYTVSFDSNGGSAVSGQTLPYGDKVTRPTNPTRSSNTFNGWYKDSAHTALWNFNTDTITGNITLYANWTYVSSGGNSGPDTTPTLPTTPTTPTVTPPASTSGGSSSSSGSYNRPDSDFTPIGDLPVPLSTPPFTEILDDGVPLVNLPQTGGSRNLISAFVTLVVSGACILGGLVIRKRKQEE